MTTASINRRTMLAWTGGALGVATMSTSNEALRRLSGRLVA